MKYADGEAFERMGISRSSSWPIVKRTGAGAACAACCGDWSGAGRRAGLLAASAFSERNIAKLASVTVFKRDAPRCGFTGSAKLLVYAYAPLFSNRRSQMLPSRHPHAFAQQRLDAFGRLGVATPPAIIALRSPLFSFSSKPSVLSVAYLRVLCVKFRKVWPTMRAPCKYFDG